MFFFVQNARRDKAQKFTSSCLVGTMPRDLPEDSAVRDHTHTFVLSLRSANFPHTHTQSPKRGRKDSKSKPEVSVSSHIDVLIIENPIPLCQLSVQSISRLITYWHTPPALYLTANIPSHSISYHTITVKPSSEC